VAPCTQKDEQFNAAHGWHLNIRNNTRSVSQMGRLQEILSRSKIMRVVSMRSYEVVRSRADGSVIVNDRNQKRLWQSGLDIAGNTAPS
jgi:hypothetical protein